MKQITESLEVLAAAAALSLRTRAALADDGKVSFFEALGYLGELPVISAAFRGVREVPGELMDLDEGETEELAAGVALVLQRWGVSYRVQDITAELLRAAVDLARSVVRIVNLPPSAVAVE